MKPEKQCPNCGEFIELKYKDIIGSGDFIDEDEVVEFTDYLCICDLIVRVFENNMEADII